MKKRDYLYKSINAIFYGISIFIYVVLFIYINQQWDSIPEEIQYIWGIIEMEDVIATKWGIFILISAMLLHVKRINKKTKKYEKKNKKKTSNVRLKNFTSSVKTTLISTVWTMIIMYIVQNSFGKQIENGIHYIILVILAVLMLDFIERIILILLNKKDRKNEVRNVKSSRRNFKKVR